MSNYTYCDICGARDDSTEHRLSPEHSTAFQLRLNLKHAQESIERYQIGLAAVTAERDAANEAVAAAHTLVSEYKGRIARAESDSDCMRESCVAQKRNTLAFRRERDESRAAFAAVTQRISYLEKTKLKFPEAFEACQRGISLWKQNASVKWKRCIEGTPIENDLSVFMAEAVAQLADARFAASEADNARLKTELARLQKADEIDAMADAAIEARDSEHREIYWRNQDVGE